MDPELLKSILPIIIIAVVFAFRFRHLNKPRPYKLAWQWVMPLVMALLFGFLLVTLPPTPLGWALLFMGLAIGAFVGIKRGQLMHFERDPVGGGLLVRQSPAALIFLFVIMATRRVFSPGGGAPSADAAGTSRRPRCWRPTRQSALLSECCCCCAGRCASARWPCLQQRRSQLVRPAAIKPISRLCG